MFISFNKASKKYGISHVTLAKVVAAKNVPTHSGFVYFPNPLCSKFNKPKKIKAVLMDEQKLIEALCIASTVTTTLEH